MILGEGILRHPVIAASSIVGCMAIAGGVMLGYDANAHTSEHVNQVTLNKLELIPGKYCDAAIGGDIGTESTKHVPAPIVGSIGNSITSGLGLGDRVPDLINRTQVMTGGLQATVCTKQKSIDAVPDANGDYNINLVVSPDPTVSDVELIVYPSPDKPLSYQPRGNFTDVGVQAVMATIQATGQSFGKNIKTFESDIDADLQKKDYSIGVEAFVTKCAPTGISLLRQANQVTANLNTGSDVPHTIQEDLADQVIKQAKTPVSKDKVHVHFEFVGQGVANNYSADAASKRADAKKNHVTIPSPSQMPDCKVETGKPAVK